MKPKCLEECSQCGKLQSDHTFKEIHDHYGYNALIEFLAERENETNKESFAKVRIAAVNHEYNKMFERFMGSHFKIFELDSIDPVSIYDDCSSNLERMTPEQRERTKKRVKELISQARQKPYSEYDNDKKKFGRTEFTIHYSKIAGGVCSNCKKSVFVWGDLAKQLCIGCDEQQRS